MSSTTKRVREVSWEDVMESHHLRDIPDKDQCVQELQRWFDNAAQFLDMKPHLQSVMCENCGITGWKDQLISAINDISLLKDLGEPQPKKPREYAISEEHFQVTLAQPTNEQKPVATFYLVDANYPIRLQIYEENLRPLSDRYNFTDLCRKLRPPSISKGSYHIIKVQPRVYLYTFETTLPASKAKLDHFYGNCRYVPSEKILPPYQSTKVYVFCLTKFTMYDKRYVERLLDSSTQLLQIANEHRSPPPELIEEVTKCGDALNLFHDSESQPEVAINATLINVLRKSIFIRDFEVQPFSTAMSSLNVCKYAASRQDIVIYHREKYIQKGHLNAAFISFGLSSEEEIAIEAETVAEECTIVGSAFKLKLSAGSNFGQLAANMLKLAADLCVQCIKGGNVLIKEIKIYGALIDVHSDDAKPASLQICFNKESTFLMGTDWMPVTDCMYSIHKSLSSDL